MDTIEKLLLQYLQGVPAGVFWLVCTLTAVFLIGYAIKGTQVWRQLNTTMLAVRALGVNGRAPNPDVVGAAFQSEPLRHLWDEYADTLHELKIASSGMNELFEFRATVPADSIFTRDVLVDSRLFDEFNRHLPGVLTGLGIIGTFAGILVGLRDFHPGEIDTAIKGLGPLLDGVRHAFVASCTAIACAMMVVFISRLTLAYLYRLVEGITHAIDSLYSTGAGEEYLGRLVKASEQSAASTAQLKDALVEDLKTMMTNLVERQIASQEATSQKLAVKIGETISTSLAEPMRRVSDAMAASTRGNAEQVTGLLETMLTGFMAKLEDTFGGQMRGINEHLQRSMETMGTVQSSLQGLLVEIKNASDQTTTRMSGALEEAMKSAAENQGVLTEQMREFVQEFRRMLTDENAKSAQAMDSAVMQVLAEVSASMKTFASLRLETSNDERERNQRLSTQTTELIGGLTSEVDGLLDAISEQVLQTQKNIDALGQVSVRAIDGMNQGAMTMANAAQRFETAGSNVTTVFERSSKISETLTVASTTLQVAATAVQRGFEQYDSTRKTVDAQVNSLMGLIESAKKESGVSNDLVANIRASADALRRAEADSREHLESVNAALVRAFTDFGAQLLTQVKATIRETDTHLAHGAGHLNAVVEELAKAAMRMKKV